ncbi:MAG: T9SS type A sorting domain-containing protein [Bacteroidota bacterium]
MIKRILFSLILSVGFIAAANAQCTPDPLITSPGIYPDTLASGVVGQPYTQVLTVVVPLDTIILGFPTNIDSLVVTNITGLPPTITYQCNVPHCSFPGNSTGCALFSGTPVAADTGIHVVHIIGNGYVSALPGTAIPFDDSSLTMKVYPATGISGNTVYSFEVMQNSPNPFISTTEISYTVPHAQDVDFKITSILGQVQHQEVLKAKNGKNTFVFNAKKLQSGVYFYTLTSKGQKVTHRMVVN